MCVSSGGQLMSTEELILNLNMSKVHPTPPLPSALCTHHVIPFARGFSRVVY